MMSDSLHTEAATAERYWVVGGNYETMEFDRVVPGTEDVFGPFGSIQDAESVWRCVAEKTRYQATVRYTIAAEQTCVPQASYRPAVGEAESVAKETQYVRIIRNRNAHGGDGSYRTQHHVKRATKELREVGNGEFQPKDCK